MREKIIAEPATLSASLAEVEKNIEAISDPKIKGPHLVHCAAGLLLTHVQAAQPDVLRLAQEGLTYPLEIEDRVKALTVIGDAMAASNVEAPKDNAKRQAIAESYLTALKIIMDKVKTWTVDQSLDHESFTVGGARVLVDKMVREEEQRREDIRQNNRLIEQGDELLKRLTGLYSTSEVDQRNLRKLAESMLVKQNYVELVFERGYRRPPSDNIKPSPAILRSSPPPALPAQSFP